MNGRLRLVADVALFSGDRVLVVKYKDTRKYDQQAGWFLPDDYMRRLEHPEDAALRILKDQVGMDTVRVDLRFIESFEGNNAWHLVFHFAGTLPDGSSQRQGRTPRPWSGSAWTACPTAATSPMAGGLSTSWPAWRNHPRKARTSGPSPPKPPP